MATAMILAQQCARVLHFSQLRHQAKNLFPGGLLSSMLTEAQPQLDITRTFSNWHMRKDYLKRKVLKKNYPERLRLNAIRKNTILPKEIQEIADKEIDELPRASSIVAIRGRCAITSRPRAVLRRWRLSRFVWRHQADYNYMSGVTRAWW